MLYREFESNFPILASFSDNSTHYKRRSKKGKISLVKKGKRRKILTLKQLAVSAAPIITGVTVGGVLGSRLSPGRFPHTSGYLGAFLGGAIAKPFSNRITRHFKNQD